MRGCRLRRAQKPLIHLAALQLRRLPAGIDPLDFDADRPHQRCERGHDRELAVRLALIGRELREELVAGDSGRGRQFGLRQDAGSYFLGRLPRRGDAT